MTGGATEWIWEHSRASNGSLIVLLAIAREAGKKGSAEMTVMEIARKSRLSERSVQAALRDLERLGELSVTGSGRRRTYLPRGADIAPLPASRGADSAPPSESVQSGQSAASGADSELKRGADSAPPPKPSRGAESAPQSGFSIGLPASRGADSAGVNRSLPDTSQAQRQGSEHKRGAESAPHEKADVLDLGSVVSGEKSRSKPTSEPPREDVERLCQHLASRIEANGSKRPSIGKRWRDAARLLIDNDGRTEQQVMAAIDWSQANSFWKANIMSMPKLREKYDTLRIQATEEQKRKSQPGRQQETDDQFKRAMQRIKARKENANGTGGDGDDRPLRQVALPPADD